VEREGRLEEGRGEGGAENSSCVSLPASTV